ncbi:MAG: hypothetical protein C0619_07845 [Desulfuromonas sp.]|nr:MAG: hypothetical protein C0619_07845 [Desulfuromonas sp.]
MRTKIICCFALLLSLLGTPPARGTDLHIRVLDVGEGQSVLLQQNSRAVLIDTGHAGVAGQLVARLQKLQVKNLDYLVLTHLHPDHASGLFRVREAWPQAVVADPCYPVTGSTLPDMVRWVDQALQQVPDRRCLAAGDSINWGEVSLAILWPLSRPADGAGVNQSSLVLEIRYADKSVLIMGDAGERAEQYLLSRELLRPVDVLVVGHHGADDATGAKFLRVIQPKKAIISTNKENSRGYPSPRVIKRLEAQGIEVYKTYESGEIHIVF